MSTTCVMNVTLGFYENIKPGMLNPSANLVLRGMRTFTANDLEWCRKAVEEFCEENKIKIIDDSSLKEKKNVN